MFTKITKNSFKKHSKVLLALVLPIVITQFSQSALGVVDAIMAGQVSALDLAAVSIGAGMWMPIFLLASGTLIATTPLIGEVVGRNEHEHVAHITQQSLWTAIAIGVVGFVLVNISPLLFEPMGVPENIRPIARSYLHWVSFGFPAMTCYAVLRCYSEALGRPQPVTLISIIGLLADIPLNYIFIYGKFGLPAMGGAGCGVATALVLWINVLLLALYLSYSKHHTFASTRFFYGFNSPNKQQISKLLKLGVPIGVAIFFEASLFSMAALVISALGEIAVAAHQIALSVSTQIFMIPLSISMALTIMVSNRFGENNLPLLKEVITTGLIWSFSISLLSVVGLYIWRADIAMAFGDNKQVQQIAIGLLIYAMGYQVFDAWQVSIAGILRGIQDTSMPMIITFFCYWLVALPLGIYLVRYTDIGVQGFWMALVTGLSLAAILLSVRLKHQLKQVTIKNAKSVS
ncbi:MATE family efflux transporter [Psychrobacter sp. HD31]|uniref:MATE family efflux transporter n=1 Tax=Psychrobacter sp. HD31 TaxID=3112003 RepID=UPI003DA627CF